MIFKIIFVMRREWQSSHKKFSMNGNNPHKRFNFNGEYI